MLVPLPHATLLPAVGNPAGAEVTGPVLLSLPVMVRLPWKRVQAEAADAIANKTATAEPPSAMPRRIYLASFMLIVLCLLEVEARLLLEELRTGP